MSNPKKIAIIVPNPCNPDYRVIRQAETFAKAGHEVILFATKNADTPYNEVFNGVRYIRHPWRPIPDFIRWLTGAYKSPHELEGKRDENRRYLEHVNKEPRHHGRKKSKAQDKSKSE